MKKVYLLMLSITIAMMVAGCEEQQSKQDLTFVQLMEQSTPEQVEAWYNGVSCLSDEYTTAHAAELRQQKKLLVFDLDGTLSNHKCPLPEANRKLLDELGKRYHIVMCGAGNAPRIFKQMEQYPIEIVGNYGMQHTKVVDGELVFTKEVVCEVDKDFFNEKTAYLREKYGYTEFYGEPIEFHKSGMVTIGLLGTEAPKDLKIAFDPDRSKRRIMYPEVVEIFKDYTVYIGGSSSFDIVGKQYNKYDATMEYARMHGYTKEQILFLGDDMGDGGGDSHIRLGGIDYLHILDYTKIPERMAFLLE